MQSACAQLVSRPRASRSASTTVRSFHGQRVHIRCTAQMVSHQGKTLGMHAQPMPLLSHRRIHPPSKTQHHPPLALRGEQSANRLLHGCSRPIRADGHWNSSASAETRLDNRSPRIPTRPSPSSVLFRSQGSPQNHTYPSRFLEGRGYRSKLPR